MKRTLALTVVTALCAVSPFVAGAAMSSLQQPGATLGLLAAVALF